MIPEKPNYRVDQNELTSRIWLEELDSAGLPSENYSRSLKGLKKQVEFLNIAAKPRRGQR